MTFQFRPILTISALVAIAILLSLGTWQLHRLNWKRELISLTEARVTAEPTTLDELDRQRSNDPDFDPSYSPVRVTGQYRHDLEMHVFGTLEGAAGYYVFTPLQLASAESGDAEYVYVNRGFVKQALKSPVSRLAGQIKGEVTVEGLYRTPAQGGGWLSFLQPPNDLGENVWHERQPDRFAMHTEIAAATFYLDSLGSENPAAWPKGGTTRLEFSNRHLEYALTWYGLAAALVGVYGFYSIKRD